MVNIQCWSRGTQEAPPPNWGGYCIWWLSEEGEALFFRGVAPGRLTTLQRTAPLLSTCGGSTEGTQWIKKGGMNLGGGSCGGVERRSAGSRVDKFKIHCIHLQISSRINKKHYFKKFLTLQLHRCRDLQSTPPRPALSSHPSLTDAGTYILHHHVQLYPHTSTSQVLDLTACATMSSLEFLC